MQCFNEVCRSSWSYKKPSFVQMKDLARNFFLHSQVGMVHPHQLLTWISLAELLWLILLAIHALLGQGSWMICTSFQCYWLGRASVKVSDISFNPLFPIFSDVQDLKLTWRSWNTLQCFFSVIIRSVNEFRSISDMGDVSHSRSAKMRQKAEIGDVK